MREKEEIIIINRFNTYRSLKSRLIHIARIIAINYSRNMFIIAQQSKSKKKVLYGKVKLLLIRGQIYECVGG